MFEIAAESIGNQDAGGAEVRAALPPNTQFVSASGVGTYDALTNEVVWSLGTLPAQGTATLQFIAVVDEPLLNGTLLTSSASATSNESLPAAAQATVTVSSAPLLLFSKQGPVEAASFREIVTFTLTLENRGNENATGVRITDQLPVGLVASSASYGGVIGADDRQVSWDLGTLAAGAPPVSLSLDARVRDNSGTGLVNVATVTSNETPDIQATARLDTVQVEFKPVPVGSRLGMFLLALLVVSLGLVHGKRRRFDGHEDRDGHPG
jgi:uncharacterized repeat protein (TIGR01451 family)